MTDMKLPGKRVRRTRLVRTDRYVVAVEVEAVIPDAASPEFEGEAFYEPHTVELLRQIEQHAKTGDINWLKQHGKVYAAVEAA